MNSDETRMPTTEEEWAEYYENHKDDPDVWSGTEIRAEPRKERNLSVTITVRFAPDEAAIIRRLAKERESSYSEVVRGAVRALSGPTLASDRRIFTFMCDPGSQVHLQEHSITLGRDFYAGATPATEGLRRTG